jgi:hypothetical protein
MNPVIQYIVGVLIIWVILAVVNNIGFATPIISGAIQTFDDESAVSGPLMEQVGDDYGVYYIQDQQSVLAFFAVQPGASLSYPKYFSVEFASQLIVAFILAAILMLTRDLPYANRVGIVALMAIGAGFIIHSQYGNWWGLSARYGIPAILIFFTAWTLSTAVVARWIITSY